MRCIDLLSVTTKRSEARHKQRANLMIFKELDRLLSKRYCNALAPWCVLEAPNWKNGLICSELAQGQNFTSILMAK